MNKQIIKALDRGHKPMQLAVAAHEMGHAVGTMANGHHPAYVKLKFEFLGGLVGGECDYGDPPREDWSPQQHMGRLIAMMAGHAAETRFCQLYLGMNFRKAFTYGRDSSAGDYAEFQALRKWAGLRWKTTENEAFHQATQLLERQSTYLDDYTLRLDRARYLDGSAL